MGAIGYGGADRQENKVNMSICWYTGHGFRPYGRGNFPGHDVLGGLAKSGKMGVDGHRSVWMDAVGLVGMGGTRNSKKKFENVWI